TQSHLFRAPREAWEEPKQLTKGTGLFSGAFGKNTSLWLLTSRTPHSMPTTTVMHGDGSPVAELPSVADKEPFQPRFEIVEVGLERTLNAAIVLPRQLDARKKYPVIVDVYGGPHHLQVQATRSRWLDRKSTRLNSSH